MKRSSRVDSLSRGTSGRTWRSSSSAGMPSSASTFEPTSDSRPGAATTKRPSLNL